MSGERIAYGSDPDQFGEWWAPVHGGGVASGAGTATDYSVPDATAPDAAAPVGTAMLLHGGYYRSGRNLDLMHAMAADLAARGWAVWNVEYRRPDAHDWPATLADVRAALLALRSIPSFVPAAPLIVIGHSAGGQLALQLAEQTAELAEEPAQLAEQTASSAAGVSDTSSAEVAGTATPVTAPATPATAAAAAAQGASASAAERASAYPRIALAVSLAGVVDLPGAWARGSSDGAVAMALGGTPDEQPERYAAASPSLFRERRVPWLLVQGTDDVDDFALPNRDLAANGRVGHPELLELPGDHFAVIDPAAPIWHATVARIAELLPRA